MSGGGIKKRNDGPSARLSSKIEKGRISNMCATYLSEKKNKELPIDRDLKCTMKTRSFKLFQLQSGQFLLNTKNKIPK